jgi:hypothetical protein
VGSHHAFPIKEPSDIIETLRRSKTLSTRLSMLRRIQQTLLIDRPLFYALAARVWQAISGPITISLILTFLSPSETGVYYSLGAIVGIQVFFDLGLSNVLISQAGYAISSSSKSAGTSEPAWQTTALDPGNARLSELIRVSERWFLGASILFGITSLALGLASLRNVDIAFDWKPVLVVLVLLNAISFALTASQAILEGSGKREVIYRFRFYQAVTGSLSVWLALSLGFKLWSLVAAASIQTSWAAYLRFRHEADFFARFRKATSQPTDFSWMRDIVPVQWRQALMSIAFFLATQFLILIVLRYDSEVEAGRLGITLSIVTAIQMFALAWIHTNFSTAAIQHGSGNREQVGTHWRRLALVSVSMLAFALASFILVLALLPMLNRGFESRFIAPWQLAIFSIGCLANHLISTQALYVLSQCARPLTFASSIGFLSTAVAVWIGGSHFGITGLVAAYSIAMTCICLPLHSWAYLRFRQNTSPP